MAVASPSPVKILSDLGYEIWEIENDADLRSALIEAINTLSMGNPSDQRIPILQEAVKNIQRSKFKERSINVGKLMNRKASSAQQISPQKLLPAASESGEGNQTLLTENLAKRLNNIAENLNALSRVLKQQFNLDKQSAQQSKIDKDEEAKKAREGELEGGKGKGILGKTFDAFTKPFGNFFNAITRWLNNVLLGTGALALLKWLQDPENQARIQAFWDFLTDTLPKIITEFFDALQSNWLARILFPSLPERVSGKGKGKGDDDNKGGGDGSGETATVTQPQSEIIIDPNVTETPGVSAGGEVVNVPKNEEQPNVESIPFTGSAGGEVVNVPKNEEQPNVESIPFTGSAGFPVPQTPLIQPPPRVPGFDMGQYFLDRGKELQGTTDKIKNWWENIDWESIGESSMSAIAGAWDGTVAVIGSILGFAYALWQFGRMLTFQQANQNLSAPPSENIASLDLTKKDIFNNIPPPLEGSNGTQIVDLRETASAAVGGSSGSGSASSGPSHIKGANSLFAASVLNIGNA